MNFWPIFSSFILFWCIRFLPPQCLCNDSRLGFSLTRLLAPSPPFEKLSPSSSLQGNKCLPNQAGIWCSISVSLLCNTSARYQKQGTKINSIKPKKKKKKSEIKQKAGRFNNTQTRTNTKNTKNDLFWLTCNKLVKMLIFAERQCFHKYILYIREINFSSLIRVDLESSQHASVSYSLLLNLTPNPSLKRREAECQWSR